MPVWIYTWPTYINMWPICPQFTLYFATSHYLPASQHLPTSHYLSADHHMPASHKMPTSHHLPASQYQVTTWLTDYTWTGVLYTIEHLDNVKLCILNQNTLCGQLQLKDVVSQTCEWSTQLTIDHQCYCQLYNLNKPSTCFLLPNNCVYYSSHKACKMKL